MHISIIIVIIMLRLLIMSIWRCAEQRCDTRAGSDVYECLVLIGINSKLECDVLISKSIMQLAPDLLPLCMRF